MTAESYKSDRYEELKFEDLTLRVGFFYQPDELDTDTQAHIELETIHIVLPDGTLLDAGDLIAELGAWEALEMRVWAHFLAADLPSKGPSD